MTITEMTKVMLAYERGEQIEYRDKDAECWSHLHLNFEPYWNWAEFEYRVKIQPAYHPYKNVQEFLQAQKEHGMNIRLNGCNYCRLPLYITDTLIGVQCPQSNGSVVSIDVSYKDLLRDYTWQDGTPCGVKEE